MIPSDSPAARSGPWTSLWVVAALSLFAQLWLCQFFSFGQEVPESLDGGGADNPRRGCFRVADGCARMAPPIAETLRDGGVPAQGNPGFRQLPPDPPAKIKGQNQAPDLFRLFKGVVVSARTRGF